MLFGTVLRKEDSRGEPVWVCPCLGPHPLTQATRHRGAPASWCETGDCHASSRLLQHGKELSSSTAPVPEALPYFQLRCQYLSCLSPGRRMQTTMHRRQG